MYKKIKRIKDLYKILITYFISTIVSGFVEHLPIEYDYIPNPNFIYSLIDFTPKEGVFPLMTVISLITTLPFQYIIHTLNVYLIGRASYIVVPIYYDRINFYVLYYT